VRIGAAVLFLVVFPLMVIGAYDLRAYKNLSTQEGMDAAQLAHNISDGKGFTTDFVRPFSMYLLRKRYIEQHGTPASSKTVDMEQMHGNHPDLANPPVYPLVLAAMMKVAGTTNLTKWKGEPPPQTDAPRQSFLQRLINAKKFKFSVNLGNGFWSPGGRFYRYQPDFLIALFNQFLLCLLTVLVFFIARFMFDTYVAFISAAVLFGTEVMWRFSVSGLSTTLLSLIFTGLIGTLALLEREGREPKWRAGALWWLAAAVGALTGLGALTRYSIAWVIFPVLGFLILFCGRRRFLVAALTLLTFLLVLGPWLIRNHGLSGAFFGIPGYAIVETSAAFPGNTLQRFLEPDLSRVTLMSLWFKMQYNIRPIVLSELPRLGGSWVSAFFLVGMMVGFRNVALRRIRYFLAACLVLFMFVQALGRTQLTDDSPDFNSENLLVLLFPLVLVYGVSLFFMLLEHIQFPVRRLRYVAIAIFTVVNCLPLLMVFVLPRSNAIAYPPYHPQRIQGVANWMQQQELMMSDIPWAVAWYGDQQCVWITLGFKGDPGNEADRRNDFFAIHDYIKPVSLLYLTPQTIDNRLIPQWIGGDGSWGRLVLRAVINSTVPADFPLSKSPMGWLPEQLVLTDKQRWPNPSPQPP
jgi:hypothetical protein